MKARVKATGQIIDVFPTEPPMGSSGVTYYTENVESNIYYTDEALDFKDVIDWEQRRYEIARDVLAALYSNSDESLRNEMNSFGRNIYDCVIAKAETLIAHLKNE